MNTTQDFASLRPELIPLILSGLDKNLHDKIVVVCYLGSGYSWIFDVFQALWFLWASIEYRIANVVVDGTLYASGR